MTTTVAEPDVPFAQTSHEEKLFPRLTAEQQERAVQYGMGVVLNPGEVLFTEGDKSDGIYIVAEGEVKITRSVAGGDTVLAIHGPGEFTGELAALTGGTNIATGRAVGPAQVVRLSQADFHRMLTAEPDIRNVVVPAMVQRRPDADRMVLEREKLAALGRLAAGLAHEVNNPAAAASSAVKELERKLDTLLRTALEAGQRGMTSEQMDHLEAFRHRIEADIPAVTAMDALERGDRENAIIDWLDARNIEESWEVGPCLVDAGATVETLDDLAAGVSEECLGHALDYIVATSSAKSLVHQIDEATGRIIGLVKTVKEYSYMDQAPKQEVNVNDLLRTTVSLLSQFKKDVAFETELSNSCPPIVAFGSELNQVWTNLIANAVDAIRERREKDAGPPGRIRVTTRCEFDHILVGIEDNGSGIPQEHLSRMFEPFFTTKGPGKGTGLGLDIVQRIIVGRHGGDIKVDSEPGRTRFEIRLPTGFAQIDKNGNGK